MTSQQPVVSVGLPVRNGANFVGEAIDAVRDQTFGDLELIVSDNASTDSTPEIVQGVERGDERVRYLRQHTNVGAAANYNVVLAEARGRYFCWIAHDDYWSPEYLERCVEILDSHREVVLCFSGFAEVDPDRREIGRSSPRPELESQQPHLRFRNVMQHSQVRPIFGLIRTDVLRRARPTQPHVGSDRALLAELVLQGPFRELPETHFFSRQHPGRYANATTTPRERSQWWLPEGEQRPFLLPNWTRLADYRQAIRRVPLRSDERRRCWGELFTHARRQWRPLIYDLGAVAPELVSGWAAEARAHRS